MEAIVIPIKPTSLAKGRLSRDLSAADRRRLTLSMFHRVLQVASKRALTIVVTSDTEAADIAKNYGCMITDDPGGGLNPAAERGRDEALQQGATSVLVLHADVPLIDTDALDQMFSANSEVVIGAAKDGGTNALLTSPPACIPYRFGKASAQAHTEEALRLALVFSVIENPKIAFDLDDWADLEKLARSKVLPGDEGQADTIPVAQQIVSAYSKVGG